MDRKENIQVYDKWPQSYSSIICTKREEIQHFLKSNLGKTEHFN